MSKPVQGGCFCGTVRFEVDLPTKFCVHCHCTMCRRLHGAAFVTWIGVAPEAFRITAGHDRLTRLASSDHGTRTFCSACGSAFLCESTQHADAVTVTLANLDGPIDRTPQAHIYHDDHADWVSVDDSLPRVGG